MGSVLYQLVATTTAENNLKLRGVRRAEDHKVWAREVGAYPIIGILSFAVGFCAWRCTKCATECSDVRWVPSKRQQLIRTWDDTK